MQFPQDNIKHYSGTKNEQFIVDDLTDFERHVMYSLQSMDNKLTSLCAQRDLMQELLSHRMNMLSSSLTENNSQQRPVYFKVTLFKNAEGVPLRFRLSGRTYDIRDHIKTYGNPVWNKEFKCWDFEYNEGMYNALLNYLSTLTNEITYIEDYV